MRPDEWHYPYRIGLVESGPLSPLKSQVVDLLATALSPGPWDVAMDLGCGAGGLTRALAARLTPSIRWVLMDRDRQLLAEAHRAMSAGNKHALPVAADLDRLPLVPRFSSASVLVLASHTLYYATSWQHVMHSLVARLRAGRRPCAAAVVLRSRRSDSYVLRRAVRRVSGESDPRLLHGDELAAWLAAEGTSWTRHRATTSYRPPTRAIGEGLRAVVTENAELRATLTLLCHADPVKMAPQILAAVERLVAKDGPQRPPALYLEDEVFIIRNDHFRDSTEECSAPR